MTFRRRIARDLAAAILLALAAAGTARGSEVLRFAGGFALHPSSGFAIEVRRDGSGVVTLTARDPTLPSQAVSAPVSAKVWRAFVALRAQLVAEIAGARRRIAAQDARARRRMAAGGLQTVVVCADGGGLSIDSVLGGRAEHIEGDDCRNAELDPWMETTIPALALANLPGCEALQPSLFGVCAMIGGDRRLAGRFAWRAIEQGHAFCEPNHVVSDLAAAEFRTGAANDGSGGRAVDAKAFRAEICGADTYFSPQRIVAGGGALAVRGKVSRDRDGHTLLTSYRQIWRVDGDGLTLEKWSIGAFARSD